MLLEELLLKALLLRKLLRTEALSMACRQVRRLLEALQLHLLLEVHLVERLLRRREVSDTVNASINSFVWKRLDGQCGFYCRNASGSLSSGIIFWHSINN